MKLLARVTKAPNYVEYLTIWNDLSVVGTRQKKSMPLSERSNKYMGFYDLRVCSFEN